MSISPSIIWFRLDLRLADNPALQAGINRGGAIVPILIHAPEEEAPWQPGAASRWWLHQSLRVLATDLKAAGSTLIIRQGSSLAALRRLIKETGAGAVFFSRRYEPAVLARDAKIKEALLAEGLEVESFNGSLLHEPWTVQNQSGKPFQVFTPFWRHCLGKPAPALPSPRPERLAPPVPMPKSLPLEALELEPKTKWAEGIRTVWRPGAAGALTQLKRFLKNGFLSYSTDRDRPDRSGTSRLSPHLHFGEISPRQIWHAVRRHAQGLNIPEPVWRGGRFLTELGWREFAHHLLYHFPHTPTEPLRPQFRMLRWRKDAAWLKAWQRGRTGYPIVDAGMRQLWTTGWMHNRVRMIAASFLVKHLLISWREGAAWFWDTLVDADLAQNTLGWQWTAGCGADAAPFFRIFNPTSQALKFDPEGVYVRKWVAEIAKLPDRWLHEPWKAPADLLTRAGIELDRTYPTPIASHGIAREVALEALRKMRTEG